VQYVIKEQNWRTILFECIYIYKIS